jgi:hypothetical protein
MFFLMIARTYREHFEGRYPAVSFFPSKHARMNLALFDFDGTITRKETFGAFMRFATPRFRRVLGAPFLPRWLPVIGLGWFPQMKFARGLCTSVFVGCAQMR